LPANTAWGLAFLLAGIAFLLYLNSIQGDFVLDDAGAVNK